MLHSVPDIKEEFWQKVEASLGCKICAYALAQYSVSVSRRNTQNALWGIVYISTRGIHFYRFAQQSLIGSLIKSAPLKEFSLSLWFEDIQDWREPKKLPFLKSLFVRDDSCLIVRGRGVEFPRFDTSMEVMHTNETKADVLSHYFALDIRKKNIIEALTLYAREKRV